MIFPHPCYCIIFPFPCYLIIFPYPRVTFPYPCYSIIYFYFPVNGICIMLVLIIESNITACYPAVLHGSFFRNRKRLCAVQLSQITSHIFRLFFTPPPFYYIWSRYRWLLTPTLIVSRCHIPLRLSLVCNVEYSKCTLILSS